MPRGPKGEKRLADVIGNAVLVMKIGTGKLEDQSAQKNPKLLRLVDWRQEGRLKGIASFPLVGRERERGGLAWQNQRETR